MEEVTRFRRVVEAHHADVLGNAAAGVVQSPDHPERSLVVGGEDGGDVGVTGEAHSSVVAAASTPIAGHGPPARRRVCPQRIGPAAQACRGVDPGLRAGHMVDRAVPEVEQVLRCQPCAFELVDGHRWCADGRVTAHHDEWHVAIEFSHGLNDPPHGSDNDDPLHMRGTQAGPVWTPCRCRSG